MYETFFSILVTLMLSYSLSRDLNNSVLIVEGKIRENNEDQKVSVLFENPVTEHDFFDFDGFKVISMDNPKKRYRIRSSTFTREDKTKGDGIWVTSYLNTTGVPNGKYEIISYVFYKRFYHSEYEYPNHARVEIDILKDELCDVYLINLTHCSGGIVLHFNKGADLIDLKKLDYLILYEESMGDFVPHLTNCKLTDNTHITCNTNFNGAHHSEKHLVRNIPYGDNYIKAKKYLYFYP